MGTQRGSADVMRWSLESSSEHLMLSAEALFFSDNEAVA